METKTIIYLVAAALIFRVIVKLITRYTKERKMQAQEQSGKEKATADDENL